MVVSAETMVPSWLHRWAVFTVCATFVLLFLGTVVTTFGVGMADPIWPTYPWHLMLISWDEPSPGFLIEHGHRLAGYVVGCCVIVLSLGLWWLDPRRWVRGLGLLALGGVVVQGLLGGFRVLLHALWGTNLAVIHGCFSQVVFSLLVGLALVTSPRWTAGFPRDDSHSGRLQRCALFTTMVLFLQIVLGAVLRHTWVLGGQRGHLAVAFLAVAAIAWLVKLAREDGDRSLLIPVWLLAGLTAVQILLGVETWIQRIHAGLPIEMQRVTLTQAALRTAHVLVGYCILAVSVTAALWCFRRPAPLSDLATARNLEGVA